MIVIVWMAVGIMIYLAGSLILEQMYSNNISEPE